ncbi:MAG: hypothetical protein IJS95_00505 [Prevotella sp.]|nr:hypothetical protein [Prevotella sp.]
MNKEKKKSPTGSIKGTVHKYGDQSFEFIPFGKGEPVYEEQSRHKNGVTVAKTRGSNSKQVVRIPLDSDEPDMFHACMEKLNEVFPDVSEAASVVKRGKVLIDYPDMRVVLNKTKGELSIEANINLKNTPNYTKQFVKLFNSINQCLAINKTSIQDAVNAQLKSSIN